MAWTVLKKIVWQSRPQMGLVLSHDSCCFTAQRSTSSKPKHVLGAETVRIGCSSGFWGDTATAAPQLVRHGELDFLVADYLSEITMSLLTNVKLKNPQFGYVPDFIQKTIAPLIKEIKHKGIKVVTNAGGLNPAECANAVQLIADKAGLHDLKIATITGDNLNNDHTKFVNIKEMFSGEGFPTTMTSLTAYLGAGAIKLALDGGADIVITGRCADSALVLGPLMHKYQWSESDYDCLAAGSLAGHLIECGAQVTGGIFTDWQNVHGWNNIGFPIVEVAESGSFVVTKPDMTGGVVSPATCAEQLVYEIGDPRNYILPDVVCDFSNVTLTQVPGTSDAVLVTGAKGKAPTPTYKICGTYTDGYRLTAVCTIAGPKAAEKGRKTIHEILQRVRRMCKVLKMDDFSNINIQVLGAEDTYGKHAMVGDGPREVVMWIAAHHSNKQALEILASEIAPAGTGMAPGLMGLVGGRPKPSEVYKLFSFLYPKELVDVHVFVNDQVSIYSFPVEICDSSPNADVVPSVCAQSSDEELLTGDHTYKLSDLAYTRSGDKGNNCNIGVVARNPAFVPYIRQQLTAAAVADYMDHVFEQSHDKNERVDRFELPGIHALNFVLKNSLGGGGIASLRSDPQGKAFGQMLLDFEFKNMPKLLS